MNRFLSLAFALLIAVALVKPAAAQNQQGNENSLLPEIDPQDIEIRSQFKARFPGLRRQPILGFDPTPHVYQMDPNRKPFMETQEQVVASLPVSKLSRPDPPPYTPPFYASDINAFSRLGIGSYISPEANFWGVSRINSKSYVGGDLDYSSSDGHLDNQQSSFRFFDANAEYATKLSSEDRITLNGGLNNSFNNMFDPSGLPALDGARKQYTGFTIGGEFRHFKNTITGWQAQANMHYFRTRLKNADMLTGQSKETAYNGSIAKRWTGSHVNETFTVKAGAKGGNYSNDQFSDNWLTAQGGLEYERLFNYSTKVTAEASVYYGSDIAGNKVYLGPSVTVKHPLLDMLTLTVKAGANPQLKTLKDLHSQNHFLDVGNTLRHSYNIHGSAEASLEYADLGVLNLGVRYENISDYPIFVRDQQTAVGGPPQNLFYEVNYADVYRARAYVSVTHELVKDRFQVNAKMYLQSPQIKNGGRIPFEEKLGINSGITVRPFDKFTFEAWADYIGSRKTFRANNTLDGFLLVGSQADVQITKRFGAYVKLVNLLNQDYQVWPEYTERPFQVYGGITVKL